MKNISKQEFRNTYGDIQVRFVNYFKYCFTFVGYMNGKTIQVEVSGAENIYRLDIDSDKSYTLRSLPFTSAVVSDEDGNDIIEYNENE